MRTTKLLITLAVSGGLLLTACGDGDSTASGELNATGDFGEKPTLEIPDDDPPADLEVDVLSEGDGTEVGEDDFVVANYLGQTWAPREVDEMQTPPEGEEDADGPVPYVFDNSYDRGAASGFSLNAVITGWKDGLAGQKVGSRVMLTIPPAQAYGAAEGEEAAGEPHDLGEDTLVFVVDIVDSVGADATAAGEANDVPDGFPTVEDGEGGAPTLDFGDAAEPEESDSTIVIQGEGDVLGENVVAHLMEAPYGDAEAVQSTWDMGMPEQLPAEGLNTLPGWDDVAADVTVGSRIVTRISAEDALPEGADADVEAEPLVLVVDILATY